MPLSRRSLLQTQILLELRKEPAGSIEQLATRLEKLRPSISRSLKLLQTEGLVVRDNRLWTLSATGVAEAEEASARMKEIAATMRNAMQSVLPHLDLKDLVAGQTAAMGSSGVQSIVKQLQASAGVREMLAKMSFSVPRDFVAQAAAIHSEPLSGLSGAFAATQFARGMDLEGINGAIRSLLEVQQQNSGLMASALETLRLHATEAFSRSVNISVTRALDDVFAIRAMGAVGHLGVSPAWLTDALPSITAAMQGVFSESVRSLADRPTVSPDNLIRLAIPPAATASYSRALRLTVDPATSGPSTVAAERGPDPELERLLLELGAPFLTKYHGMWAALTQRHPDHLRHTAVSARELVRTVLQQLIPDVELDADESKSVLKSRVKKLLGGSDSGAEWVSNLALAAVAYYKQLNSYTHEDRDDYEALQAFVVATDGMLLFFLSKAGRSRKSS